MNSINLVGRITKDLELRYTASEKAVCEFSLAVNRIGQEQADFITCVVWGKQAENLTKYQGKGSQIGVSGEIRADKYQTNTGDNRYKTYVLANNIEYLENKKELSNNNQMTKQNNDKRNEEIFKEFANEIEITDDMLPF